MKNNCQTSNIWKTESGLSVTTAFQKLYKLRLYIINMVENSYAKKIIIFGSLAILLLLALFVLKNILLSVVVGSLSAYIFHPIYKKIHSIVKNKDAATIILSLLIILVIAIPLVIMAPVMIKQTFDTYIFLQQADFITPLQKSFPSLFTGEISKLVIVNFNNFIGKFFTYFLKEFESLIADIPGLVLQFLVILFTFYFATRDGEKLKDYALKLSPFTSSTEKRFLEEFRTITDNLVYGQIFIGLIQGISVGIGLFIAGVPKVIILTVVSSILAIIPLVGAWLIWIPATLFLLAHGNTSSAIFLFLYGLLFVSLIDNVLRPYFLSKGSSLSVPVALIGMIGGLYSFGIVGLLLGPLILAYVLIIVDFYTEGKIGELFKQE